MKRFIMKENKYWIVSILIVLLLWSCISNIINKEIILPSPYDVFKNLMIIVKDNYFLLIILSSLKRTIIGFVIALVLGVILGSLSGVFNSLYIILNPVVAFMKSAPTMGLIILALIWLDSESAPIAIGLMIVFPIIYNNIYLGMKQIDKKLIEMGKLYNLSKQDIFCSIYLPSLSPYIKSSLISGVGLNFKIIIATEVISQPKFGIGTNLQIERANLNTSAVFAWILIVVASVYIFDLIVEYLFSKYRNIF